jgi:hypothetical protein
LHDCKPSGNLRYDIRQQRVQISQIVVLTMEGTIILTVTLNTGRMIALTVTVTMVS